MSTESLPVSMRHLLQPEAYPHPVGSIVCHETHISWVLEAGEFAYKIKKPVNLGFVDFSTLDRRKHFCHEEIRLNRRMAPDLYLGVVTIHDSPAGWVLAEDEDGQASDTPRQPSGEVVEYAVRMQRFPANSLLSDPRCFQQVRLEHFRHLAEDVARFHRLAEQADSASPWGTPEEVQRIALENFPPIRQLPLTESRASQLQRLEDWLVETFCRLRPLLEWRKSGQAIRECHGDLHLQNMILLEDRIRLFDCIEFNDRFRWIDPLNDIAFTTMDLRDRQHLAEARLFLAEYLQQTGDFTGVPLLGYYQVYRALVRAKVNAIRLSQLDATVDEAEQQEAKHELNRYLDLAEELTQPPRPRLFLTCGVSGTGKSTLAEQIVLRHGGLWLRSDRERKRLYEREPPLCQAPTASCGSNLLAEFAGKEPEAQASLPGNPYSPEGIARVYARLLALAGLLLQANFSVVVDATFLKREQRRPFLNLAERLGLRCQLLHLENDPQILQQRLLKRAEEASNISDATSEVLQQQLREFQSFTPEELPYVVSLETPTSPSANEAMRDNHQESDQPTVDWLHWIGRNL